MKIKYRIKDLDEVEELRDSYKNLIENCCTVLKECKNCLEIEDPDLDNLVSKLECLVWRSNARFILIRNDDCESELSKLLKNVPREFLKDGCKEFSQVKERVHAIQAAISNEQRILSQLSEYWECENLCDLSDEVKNFVEETANYILNKKIEKQLEILDQVAKA